MVNRSQATVIIVAAICLFCLASCGCGPVPRKGDYVVSDADLPATINASVGEVIALSLSSNPSTGYSWHCTWAPKATLLQVAHTSGGSASTKPGSGGTEDIVFQVLQPGQATITVQYGRWWEGGDRQDPQTVTVTITP